MNNGDNCRCGNDDDSSGDRIEVRGDDGDDDDDGYKGC